MAQLPSNMSLSDLEAFVYTQASVIIKRPEGCTGINVVVSGLPKAARDGTNDFLAAVVAPCTTNPGATSVVNHFTILREGKTAASVHEALQKLLDVIHEDTFYALARAEFRTHGDSPTSLFLGD